MSERKFRPEVGATLGRLGVPADEIRSAYAVSYCRDHKLYSGHTHEARGLK